MELNQSSQTTRNARHDGSPTNGKASTSAPEAISFGMGDLLTWFVPGGEKNAEQRRQAQCIAGATLLLSVLCTLFMISDFFRDNIPALLPIGLGAGTLFGTVILAVLKSTGRIRLAGHMLCIGYLVVLGEQCLVDTGLTNPAAIPVLLLPWVAAICLGGRMASLYAGLSTFFYSGLYALNALEYDFLFEAPDADVRVHLFLICVLMVWVVAGIGYATAKYRKQARTSAANGNDQAKLQPEVLRSLVRDLRPLASDTLGLGTALASRDSSGSSNGKTPTPHYGHLIEENSRQLLETLSAADELARLERSETEPSWERVEVPGAIECALASQQRLARQQGVDLWIETDAPVQTIRTDRQLLNRLAKQLVKSSITNLRDGQVTVTLDRKEGNTRLSVETEGKAKTGSLREDRTTAPLAPHVDLAVAEKIASKLHGRLDIDHSFNSAGSWTYSVLLPASAS